jgi:hypothetical protein
VLRLIEILPNRFALHHGVRGYARDLEVVQLAVWFAHLISVERR